MSDKVACVACGKPIPSERASKSDGLCLRCGLERRPKVACAECGKLVDAKLAAGKNGLCLRCSAQRNPFFLLYSSLIQRVFHSPEGFQGLSTAEQKYYVAQLFQNEVNNGGFHQFFFNLSGSHYDLTERTLADLGENECLALLRQAKQIVFPEIAVPVDQQVRRNEMPELAPDMMKHLDELDSQFYHLPDTLKTKLQVFARQHGLVPPEPMKP